MSDSLPQGIAPTPSAGAQLRAARERLGMPLEEISAYLKVAPRRLELIETDQFDKLPDAVFVRALVRSMCRALKIDPMPVLAQLPRAAPQLDRIYAGAEAPVRRGRLQLQPDAHRFAKSPVIGGVALLGAAALLFYFLPPSWQTSPKAPPKVDSAASAPNAAVSAPQPAVAPVVEAASAGADKPIAASAPVARPVPLAVPVPTVGGPATERPARAPAVPDRPASAPGGTVLAVPGAASPARPVGAAAAGPAASAPAPAASAPAATLEPAAEASTGLLQFRTSEPAWIEVQDAQGSVLLSRKLGAGESVGVSGTTPLKLTLGNVKAIQITFRGRAIDLQSFTRGDVARFELN